MLAYAEIGGVLTAAGALISVGPAALLATRDIPAALMPEPVRDWWRSGYEGRPAIPAWKRRAIYAADRYRCAYCAAEPDGETVKLHIDHIRPWSCSGTHALWNLITLCSVCNRAKSNFWVRADGSVYSPFTDPLEGQRAEMLFTFTRRARWSPGRWVRMGWSVL